MAKPGRKRKHCKRQPNGQPYRPPVRIEATPEVQAKRLRAFGDVKARGELDNPIDLLNGLETCLRQAGARFAATHRAYMLSIGCKPLGSPLIADWVDGQGYGQMSEESAQRLSESHRGAIRALGDAGRKSQEAVQRVLILWQMPTRISQYEALVHGLAALDAHYCARADRRAA